ESIRQCFGLCKVLFPCLQSLLFDLPLSGNARRREGVRDKCARAGCQVFFAPRDSSAPFWRDL
ncbi:unnamed protein product, partial [Oikopleura dioica]